MTRALLMLFLAGALCTEGWAQASLSPVESSEYAENRVDKPYWVRPGVNSTSVDFYAERELRTRRPVYDKKRIRILAIEAVDTSRGTQLLYLVRFDDGTEAFIDVTAFEAGLYRELAPHQVMEAPADSPIGAAPHLWIFRRSSIFATDPDVIWERIRNEGPRTFRPAKPPREKPARPARPREPKQK